MRAMNRNLLLNMIRAQGPLSRTQLTTLSGLSVGAVSQIVSDLIESNWITEAGESDSTGGRRQVLLRLNPTAAYVAGLKLMEDRAVCAVTDLEAAVLHYAEHPLPATQTPEPIAQALAQIVIHALAQAASAGPGARRDRLRGHRWRRGSSTTRRFPVADVPLARLVAESRLPVYLENDVNTLTITEQLFGLGHDVSSFAVVTVGRGIGMGVVIHHQLYRGHKGGVGELGHITVEPDGPPCSCGRRGCLEALAADEAVVREAQPVFDASLTFEQVMSAAQNGHEAACRALARSGHYLGLGLAVVINLFCPELIIVSGEGVAAGPCRLDPMFEALRANTFNGLLDGVKIEVKPTDDLAWARGAAGLVVGKLFASPLVNGVESPAAP